MAPLQSDCLRHKGLGHTVWLLHGSLPVLLVENVKTTTKKNPKQILRNTFSQSFSQSLSLVHNSPASRFPPHDKTKNRTAMICLNSFPARTVNTSRLQSKHSTLTHCTKQRRFILLYTHHLSAQQLSHSFTRQEYDDKQDQRRNKNKVMI